MANHTPDQKDPSTRLFLSILLNGLITLVEITGGILSNSLAMLTFSAQGYFSFGSILPASL